jgi:hypothetical protein
MVEVKYGEETGVTKTARFQLFLSRDQQMTTIDVLSQLVHHTSSFNLQLLPLRDLSYLCFR